LVVDGGYYDLCPAHQLTRSWSATTISWMDALAFQAVLVPYAPWIAWPDEPVARTIAVREDQTLEHLHESLRLAFDWADPHMYAFWLGARWWDDEAVRYQTPFELDPDETNVQSGRIPISEIGLRKGRTLAYLFDFGDEWRVLLKVVDRWEAGDGTYPRLIEATGTPPPQYPRLEDDDSPNEA
jgi:Plasmid pRiA4b ORF-3-like protein